MEGILYQDSAKLDDDSFVNLITEVMWAVNCRPLSVDNLYDPTRSSLEPLCANLLLTLKQQANSTPSTDENIRRDDIYARNQSN